MPIKIIRDPKGYFVENLETHKRYSKAPLEKKKAEAQFRILDEYLGKLEGTGINKEETKQIARKALSDTDIRHYFPNANIVNIPDLKQYNHIDDLIQEPTGVIFLLYESKPKYGHWVLLSKYGNTVEFNCSYGTPIDGAIKWVNKGKQQQLDLEPYLSQLLINSKDKYNLIYNSLDLQANSPDVADCGRFCCQRAYFILKHQQPLKYYNKMLKEVKHMTGWDYDNQVSAFINIM